MSTLSQFFGGGDVSVGDLTNSYIDLIPGGSLRTNPFTNAITVTGSSVGCTIINCGGNVICQSSGVMMIVAPLSKQLARTWYCRNDAVTVAGESPSSSASNWFVPTRTQLQNPGYCCRTFWEGGAACICALMWSSTEVSGTDASVVCFQSGGFVNLGKTPSFGVRAFRCVTY